ncbi:hypothetical protein [Pseudoduganella umbonata]|uniref:Membrane protein implicated in regulation of membrane protease activity n=1 Tax=Pseudoduganella umbonata TaxID=864828 RepID=A0A4P8HLE4_9BURK|nr:hypothetical protein [Pseudoduganella umbonata]MBB3219678.1 membrane protein implicated in regulation of membrane protease activity [Pseudoduganella umbonata]QCP09736.1 hypothetical protein FCL38_04340 [Pseudoduganella umbonata]
MLIVALAWIYVVLLMSVTEPTIVAGVMTFLLYCIIPLAILLYVTGGFRRIGQRRRLQRARREQHKQQQQQQEQQELAKRQSESDQATREP